MSVLRRPGRNLIAPLARARTPASGTWNAATVCRYEGRRLLLGDGSVAVTYALRAHDRVRVTFLTRRHGRWTRRASEVGSLQTLCMLLDTYVEPDACGAEATENADSQGNAERQLRCGHRVESRPGV